MTDTKQAPETLVNRDGDEVWDFSIDTQAWIKKTLGDPISPDSFLSDPEDMDSYPEWSQEWEIPGFEAVCTENVYNQENDFGDVFVFTVYAPKICVDWCYADQVYVSVNLHRGGDPRGAYSLPELYRVDCIAESGFLDWVIGWNVTDEDGEYLTDRTSIGYSDNPTCELEKWIDEHKADDAELEWDGDTLIVPLADGGTAHCTPYTGADWL